MKAEELREVLDLLTRQRQQGRDPFEDSAPDAAMIGFRR
jgi:hypothetical protein